MNPLFTAGRTAPGLPLWSAWRALLPPTPADALAYGCRVVPNAPIIRPTSS